MLTGFMLLPAGFAIDFDRAAMREVAILGRAPLYGPANADALAPAIHNNVIHPIPAPTLTFVFRRRGAGAIALGFPFGLAGLGLTLQLGTGHQQGVGIGTNL